MSKITTINEPWDRHDYPEVEEFVKASLESYKKKVERLSYDKFPERRPLTFKAAEDGVKVYFNCFNENEQTRTVEVSTDEGETWKSFTSENYDEGGNTPIASLNAGQTALVRGDNEAMGYYSEDDDEPHSGGSFRIVGRCYVYGNVMSLLDSERFYEKTAVGECAFYSLFCEEYGETWSNPTLLSHPEKRLLLPATTIAEYCYYAMFQGCASLVNAPSLPATTLASNCYHAMFCDCHSLVDAPALPATTLDDSCYHSMFHSCTSLVNAPALPATTLTEGCYYYMFNGCTSLKSTPALNIVGKLESSHITGMFRGCSSLTDVSDIRATEFGENCFQQMFVGNTSIKRVGTISATTLGPNCCKEMFMNCTALESVEALPATTLAEYCYNNMFKGCTSLVNPPALPATSLVPSCYRGMFQGCTSLVNAPELSATTMYYYCYGGMFQGCTSLASAPVLPATTMAEGCYFSMFHGCTSLVNAPALPATTLAKSCYNDMFYLCRSLTTAPELPATTLVRNCYENMFKECSILTFVKAMFTTTPATPYTKGWLYNVSATGTFVKNSAATWDVIGTYGIPEGWTVETASE